MAYGDLPLDAPEKPNKGHEGGACNRRSCQAEPALWWNHGSHSWYYADCARDIGTDVVNAREWPSTFARWFPGKPLHPMFETREQMDARKQPEPPAHIADYLTGSMEPYFRPSKLKSSSLERLLRKARRRHA